MIIDELNRNILIQIGYFGPSFSGKKTSINVLQNHFGKEEENLWLGETLQLTIFIDYRTVSFQSQKWKLKVRLYTSTGQKYYIVTKPITPQDIDGVIFVVDSQQEAYNQNVTTWHKLCDFFEDPIYTLPKVVAFNKQDVRNKFCPVDFLEEINYYKLKNIDFKITNALDGKGVLDCFEEVLNFIFSFFFERKEYLGEDFKRSHYPRIKLRSD